VRFARVVAAGRELGMETTRRRVAASYLQDGGEMSSPLYCGFPNGHTSMTSRMSLIGACAMRLRTIAPQGGASFGFRAGILMIVALGIGLCLPSPWAVAQSGGGASGASSPAPGVVVGPSPYGFLGVQMGEVDGATVRRLGLGEEDRWGVVVRGVIPGSPAEQMGIKDGDLITHVNDRPVRGPADLLSEIGLRSPGEQVDLSFYHSSAQPGKREDRKVNLSLARREDGVDVQQAIDALRNGMPIGPLALEPVGADPLAIGGLSLGPSNEGERRGLRVFAVVPNSAAAISGFFAGDLLIALDDQPIASRKDILSFLAGLSPDQSVRATFLRDGRERRTVWTPGPVEATPTPEEPAPSPTPTE